MDAMHTILATKPGAGYELIDSGDGRKLERFGRIVVSRPDPQALWRPAAPESRWLEAGAVFASGNDAGWKLSSSTPEEWLAGIGGLTFVLRPSAFKHVGVFPEQSPNWEWIAEAVAKGEKVLGRKPNVLNLFGYTGGATLAAAKAGAEVCHVDGSRSAVSWGKENAEASGLADKPIRWIVDDARAFLKREAKRGRRYDAVVMDPPSFGRGPKGEVWKIEEDFLPLLDLCRSVLSERPIFMLVNGYAAGYSAIAYENALSSVMNGLSGGRERGEMALEASVDGRMLPAGIFARWKSSDIA